MANFVFARHPGQSGADLAARPCAQGVIVRHFAKPRIADFLRITGSEPTSNAPAWIELVELI